MKKLLFLLLTINCSLISVNAQWVQVSNGMGNAIVNSIAYSGTNIFAGTGSYGASIVGVFLSTNNGTILTQTTINNRYIYAVAANGNNIFAGAAGNLSGNGVYLSTNNGATWPQFTLN